MDSEKNKKSRPIPKGRPRKPSQPSAEARQQGRTEMERRTVELRADIEALHREIAERERIQSALKQSEREYRELFESAHDAILIFRPEDEVVLEVNHRACEIYGFERQEFIGMSLEKITKDVPRGKKQIQFLLDQGFSQHYESVHYRKDGSEMALDINGSRVNYQGQWAILSVHRDVTERKRTLEALRKSEEAFRLAFEGAKDSLIWADPQTGLLTNCNKAAEDLLEKTKEEIIGQHQTTLHPPQKASLYAQIFERHIRETGVAEEEAEVITKSGKVKAVHITASVTTVGGKPIIQGIFRDVTLRKRAEETLRLERDKIEKVTQNLGAGLAVISRDYRVLWANDVLKKTYGDVEGKRCYEVYKGTQAVCSNCGTREVFEEGRDLVVREQQGFDRDGKMVWSEVATTPLRDEQGNITATLELIFSITERKRAEEQFKTQYATLQGIIESTDALIFSLDRDYRYTSFNENHAAVMKAIYGVDIEIGRSLLDYMKVEGDRAKAKRNIDRALQGERLVEEAYSGDEALSRLYFEVFHNPGRNPEGEVIGVVVFAKDITDRKRAEEALKESEEKYRLLVENSSQGILVLQDGLLQFANPRAVEYSGYTQQDLLSTPFLNFVHPDDRPMIAERYQRRLRGEDIPHVYQFRFIDKQGQAKWVEVNSVLITWKGKPAALSFLSDIHERWLAEEALRESEEKYRLLVEHASDAILVAQDGMMKFLNHRVKELTGYSERELTSRPFIEFIHPEDRPMVAERHQSRLQGKSVPPVYPFRIVTKAGEERWVEIHAITIPWQGKPATLNFLTDITERRRAEEALRESEALSRAVIEHSPVGISVRTRDGALLQVNEAWKKIWAMTDAEIQAAERSAAGQTLEQRFPYLGNAAQDVRRIFSSEGELSILFLPELEVKDPRPGAARWISQYFYAFRDEREGRVERVITLTQNITLRKELEEQFLQAQKLEAVGRLAGGVAHDFNNLLTGIMGYSDLLVKDLKRGPGDDPKRRYAEAILASANRAGTLTQQLLSLSRRHAAQMQVLDPGVVIAEVERMLRRVIGEDIELTIHTEGPGDTLGRVKADPVQLEQVLMNLAINARDAMPKGGKLGIGTQNVVLDEAYARRRREVAPGPYVMIAVSDTGHGMDADVQSHLFEPFFTTKEKGKGTGLGLSMAYSIVKQTGGHIEVESAPGKGSTFKIYLSRTEEPLSSPPGPQPRPVGGRGVELPRGPGGSETVLLAEDEEKLRALVREVLEEAGYTVLEAGDGEEALKVAGSHPGPIHLLLSDVVMPRLTGPELALRLLSLRPDTKVLYMSGYTAGQLTSQSGPGGPGGPDPDVPLLQKPFPPEVLLARVREVLGGRASPS